MPWPRRSTRTRPTALRAYAGYVGSYVGTGRAVVLARHGAGADIAYGIDRVANPADPATVVVGGGGPAPFTLDADLADGLVRLDLHLALKHRRLARRTLS
ncbi:hypothetical protein [Streptomyces phytophilus]|uniref:hypothetical protein n=1 Tax=Streptomyces phytophilus TaxID=722715 RepID=UPI00215D5E13|nr:hypothetical protein [Streptomyces phytophilus]